MLSECIVYVFYLSPIVLFVYGSIVKRHLTHEEVTSIVWLLNIHFVQLMDVICPLQKKKARLISNAWLCLAMYEMVAYRNLWSWHILSLSLSFFHVRISFPLEHSFFIMRPHVSVFFNCINISNKKIQHQGPVERHLF